MIGKIFKNFLQLLAYVSPFGYTLRPFFHKLRGVNIGKNVWISQFVFLEGNHPECITIGDNSNIGLRTSIVSHFYFGHSQKDDSHKVVIGKNVYIGPHCLILPDVNIGDNCVIQGGTVVSRSVPANTLLGYLPPQPLAKVTIPLTSGKSYQEFVLGLRPLRDKNKN